MAFRIPLIIGSSILLLSACGRDDRMDNAATENETEAVSNEAAVAPAGSALAAAEFASAVAASDLYEIESGKLAAEKAKSAELKSFAEMLVADHQKSTSDLKTAAAGASPTITVAPALDGEKQGMINSLKSAAAADFDKAFIDQQRQAHTKALDLLRQYQASGDNQALKDFAATAMPVVQGHLDRLERLQR